MPEEVECEFSLWKQVVPEIAGESIKHACEDREEM